MGRGTEGKGGDDNTAVLALPLRQPSASRLYKDWNHLCSQPGIINAGKSDDLESQGVQKSFLDSCCRELQQENQESVRAGMEMWTQGGWGTPPLTRLTWFPLKKEKKKQGTPGSTLEIRPGAAGLLKTRNFCWHWERWGWGLSSGGETTQLRQEHPEGTTASSPSPPGAVESSHAHTKEKLARVDCSYLTQSRLLSEAKGRLLAPRQRSQVLWTTVRGLSMILLFTLSPSYL